MHTFHLLQLEGGFLEGWNVSCIWHPAHVKNFELTVRVDEGMDPIIPGMMLKDKDLGIRKIWGCLGDSVS